MTVLRKIELSGGVLIFVIGVFVGTSYVRLDQQSAERVGREFAAYSTILIFSLLYVLPGTLILLGSYFHSVNARQGGQFALIIGALTNVISFLLFLRMAFLPYGRRDLFWLSFFSAGLAVLIVIVSVLIQRRQ